MAVQSRHTSGRTDRDGGRRASRAPQARSTGAMAGPVPGTENLLAIAVLADSGGLGELYGLAHPPDTVGPGSGLTKSPGQAVKRLSFVDALRCRVTWRLVAELFAAACDKDFPQVAVRCRPRCHRRQIAMYLSHVVLSMPYQTIAAAFGRDRTTVVHACAVVEDRRDDAAYDRFVDKCERCLAAVFAPLGHDDAEL